VPDPVDPGEGDGWWKSGMAILGYGCGTILFLFVYCQKDRGGGKRMVEGGGDEEGEGEGEGEKEKGKGKKGTLGYAFEEEDNNGSADLSRPLLEPTRSSSNISTGECERSDPRANIH